MSVIFKEQTEQLVQSQSLTGVDYARGVLRLMICFTWNFVCWLVFLAVSPAMLVSKPLAKRLRKSIARRWIKGVSRLIGTKVVVKGKQPAAPFFVVTNHPTWIDLFAALSLLDVVPVVEAPVRSIPMIGQLVGGLDPIWIHRRREDTARVVDLVYEAVKQDRSIIIAPETPITTIVPVGSGVRMFRAGLFEAAVRACKPVNAMSISYRVPKGYPSPSTMLTFGPNPFYLDADGKIPQSELDAFGPPRSFFMHMLGVLALPWHECTVTFDPEAYFVEDRITLANTLHDAVLKIFVPFN